MRKRINILKDLISFKRDIGELVNELSEYPWDIDEPLVKLEKQQLIEILCQGTEEKISIEDLVNWANAVESREDIDAEEEIIDVIFDLANPEINGCITKERLKEIIEKVSESRFIE